MARKKKRPAKRPAKRTAKKGDALLGPVKGATHRYLGHVRLDVGRAGSSRSNPGTTDGSSAGSPSC